MSIFDDSTLALLVIRRKIDHNGLVINTFVKRLASMQLRTILVALWNCAAAVRSYPFAEHEVMMTVSKGGALALASIPPSSQSQGWPAAVTTYLFQKRGSIGVQDFTQLTHPFMRSSSSNTPYSWILRLRMVSLFIPAQPAAAALGLFYDRMIQQVGQEINAKYNAIFWQFGDITFEMRSRDPANDIPFMMVFSLLQELRGLMGSAMVGTYEGEVASATAARTIWIRLSIAGATRPLLTMGN